MTGSPNDVGTHTWVERTGGLLTGAERRALLRPLASAHVTNAVGRLSMIVGVNSGRRARVATGRLRRPDSVLTRAAEAEARRRLTPALLNHSYRTFAFGSALGALENLDVDGEVLFAAALLHDVGLVRPVDGVDFTRASEQIARDVAENAGLSTAATNTMRTAITLHYSPGVTRAQGPVAYLLSAGAGLDVIGLRSWQLPPDILAAVIAEYPASASSVSSPPRSARRPPGCHAAGPRSCAATAPSTWPSRLPRSAAERCLLSTPPSAHASALGRETRSFGRGDAYSRSRSAGDPFRW